MRTLNFFKSTFCKVEYIYILTSEMVNGNAYTTTSTFNPVKHRARLVPYPISDQEMTNR